MKEITSLDDLEACLNESGPDGLLLFKHSTRCPISAAAHGRVAEWSASADDQAPPVVMVKVVESRPVSDAAASRLGVAHQSPQLILVKEGAAVWSASHYSIQGKAIEQAIAEHL